LLQGLESLALDLLLLNRPPDGNPDHVTARIAEQRVSLVGTPDRAKGNLAELLTTHPVVLPGHDSGVRQGFDALANRLGVRPRVAAEVDDMAMMRLLAREGVGLAVIPPIVVRDELSSGALIEIDPLPGIVETFYAVTIARRFPNPVLTRLLDTPFADLE